MPRKPLPEIVGHATELLAPLGEIRVKPMFGGYGIYCDGLFFALVAYDTLYLKADEQSEGAFRDAGSEVFRFEHADGRTFQMGYWTAPEEALDGAQAMAPWARLAIGCALRNRKPARKKER